MGAEVSPPRVSRTPPTAAVRIAAVLACTYAVVLIAVAAVLGFDWVTGRSIVGSVRSDTADRGVTLFLFACLAGAGALVWGSIRAWRGDRGLAAIIPLLVVVVVGCIGEPIDILTGSSLASNLVGASIIVLAATPVVLLLLPRSRRSG